MSTTAPQACRGLRGKRYPHAWECPRCHGRLPQQTLCLTAKPTCNHGHTSVDMKPV